MIKIECIGLEELKKIISYNKILLDHYRRHNIHNCYGDLIEETEGILKRLYKRYFELTGVMYEHNTDITN